MGAIVVTASAIVGVMVAVARGLVIRIVIPIRVVIPILVVRIAVVVIIIVVAIIVVALDSLLASIVCVGMLNTDHVGSGA